MRERLSPGLIDRNEVLELMKDAITDGPGFVLVGPYGVGKTTLLQMMANSLEAAEIRWISVESIATDFSPRDSQSGLSVAIVDDLDSSDARNPTIAKQLLSLLGSGWHVAAASRQSSSEYGSECYSVMSKLLTIYVGPLSQANAEELARHIMPTISPRVVSIAASASGYIPKIVEGVVERIRDQHMEELSPDQADQLVREVKASDSELAWAEGIGDGGG